MTNTTTKTMKGETIVVPKSLEFYCNEAAAVVGKHAYNIDGSNFSLVPHSESHAYYKKLRNTSAQNPSQSKPTWVPRNWSIEAVDIQDRTERPCQDRLKDPVSQSLYLADPDYLSQTRYLVTDLSPHDLTHFSSHTLGGAYFQYMCDGRFYEFDKNPTAPTSEITWLIRLLRQTHDFYHLIAEFYHYGWDGGFVVYNKPQYYERDLLVLVEEMCLHAFILGQTRLKAVLPIVAEWANTSIFHCSKWLKDAYPLWLETNDYDYVSRQFRFPTYIRECERWMYASFKLGHLNANICVDDYLEELQNILISSSQEVTTENKKWQDFIVESFERGLRSQPLICFQWDHYLGNTLEEIRNFLKIPRRQLFEPNSHYITADLY